MSWRAGFIAVSARLGEPAESVAAANRRPSRERRPVDPRAGGRREAGAQLAGRWIALRASELRRLQQASDPVIPPAVALAERLPAPRSSSTRRGSRLARAGLDEVRVARRGAASLARGELRLHTEMGTIDARLAPRFERLACTLRDALRQRPTGD